MLADGLVGLEKRVMSLLFGGMPSVTRLGTGVSSDVPLPNALSPSPLSLSSADVEVRRVAQSCRLVVDDEVAVAGVEAAAREIREPEWDRDPSVATTTSVPPATRHPGRRLIPAGMRMR